MKIEVQNTKVIVVEFPPHGEQKTFPNKEALINHLTSRVSSLQNCIAYYEKEIERMKVELAPKLEQLEQVSKTEGLPSEEET